MQNIPPPHTRVGPRGQGRSLATLCASLFWRDDNENRGVASEEGKHKSME